MPEVRLAWRAAVCYGSPRGQVVIGVAPFAEQCAAADVLPPESLRRYPLPGLGDSAQLPPVSGGLGASVDAFGVMPLPPESRGAYTEWDSLLTLAIRGLPELAKFAEGLGRVSAGGEPLFVAALGWPLPLERAIFGHIARDCRATNVSELRGQVEDICRRLAGAG